MEFSPGLRYYNLIVNGKVARDPWSSPWLMSPLRATLLAPKMPDVQLVPAPWEGLGLTLAQQVTAYARAHYDLDGWQVIVECWEEEQIEGAMTIYPRQGAPYEADCVWAAVTLSVLAGVVDAHGDQIAEANYQRRAAIGPDA